MPSKPVKINKRPGADKYASNNERIIEYSAGTDGAGGLISFTLKDDGTIGVHVYRQEKTVVTFHRLNRAQRFAAQVAHIKEHEAAFRGHADQDPASYFGNYGDRWDLYQRVCGDLGIEVRPEICHPNPED